MKPALSVLAGLALLATAGCRSDPAIPILERQLRLQEDEIYRLRATLDQMQDCGSACSERVIGGARLVGRAGRRRSAAPPRRGRAQRRAAADGRAALAVDDRAA